MKKMFLVSSFVDVADLFVEFVGEKCAGKTVTFIPTASLVEEVRFYVETGKKALEDLGMIVDELEISTASRQEIESKIKKNDYIYITGGNTFFLLQELKRTGADEIIKEQVGLGKIYIGESAGAVVMSRNIEYVKGMDDFASAPDIGSYSSLGMIDFYPVPHHTNFPFKESVESIITNYNGKINLCPVSNTQVIVVNGGEFEVWAAET
ncbi:peptidase E [Halomonas sp. 328]|uniref:peptidase E n=1 Tax=Halomonas sp. 328 TaxID=2776704 RepID=UPI0018A6FB51|nr:Type 1 glutamine amidotransferase-like domain-containing protein [Halomonas sp. 328]MBF8224491.1 Type 1 glutamine amidotransferase-like domain-containing protein [Halomonas sp. 328]